jgi:glycosyltransferase involved in cell wall biosynthesis
MTAGSLRIGVHLIRRRILQQAARYGGEAAHGSVFRCWTGFEAISALTRGSRSRFEIWDEVEPADAFVARCDVLVGIPDIRLLNARRRSVRRPPYLAMVMGDATRALPWPSPILRLLQSNDTMVCTCVADTQILRVFLRTPEPSSLQVAPMPGDLSPFVEGKPLPLAAVEALRQFAPDRPVILSAERLKPEKGVHGLIPLVADLHDRGHRPVLVILGARPSTGAYQQAIELQLSRAGLLEACVWLPFLRPDALAAVYARSAFVVSASTIYDNNFGYVPIESMSVGTPPIVTDWGGYRDSVVDGVTGIRMPTTLHAGGSVSIDWMPAAKAADALLRDSSRYERVRKAGRERVASTFSVEATASRYAELAEAALARREEALGPWAVTDAGRRAVQVGWTDRIDNAERTERLPRRSPRSGAARPSDAQMPEVEELHRLIYAHYATHVEPAAPSRPAEAVAGRT